MRTRLITGDAWESGACRAAQTFYADVMRRKHDDHHASHNNAATSSAPRQLERVPLLLRDRCSATSRPRCALGLAALFLRQFGHAVLEPACHDEEALLLGYNTRNKTLIVLGYFA